MFRTRVKQTIYSIPTIHLKVDSAFPGPSVSSDGRVRYAPDHWTEKGKPGESQGRKATGPTPLIPVRQPGYRSRSQPFANRSGLPFFLGVTDAPSRPGPSGRRAAGRAAVAQSPFRFPTASLTPRPGEERHYGHPGSANTPAVHGTSPHTRRSVGTNLVTDLTQSFRSGAPTDAPSSVFITR
jgi:hypothetical protein